jgi:predicted RNA-binding protein with PUA-like domain
MRYWLMKSEPDEFTSLQQGGDAPLYIPQIGSSGR